MVTLQSIGIECLIDQGLSLSDRIGISSLGVALIVGLGGLCLAWKSIYTSRELYNKEVFLQKLITTGDNTNRLIEFYRNLKSQGFKRGDGGSFNDLIHEQIMKKQSLEFKIENIEKEDVKQNLYTETDILNRRESYKYSIENNNEAGDLNNNIEQLKDWFELRGLDIEKEDTSL